jgi:adenylylsulfate kinase-like enzyme
MAEFLHRKGFHPVVSLVSPYKDQRDKFKEKMGKDILEVYVHTTQIRGRENYFAQNYSSPESNFLDLSTDSNLEECVEKAIQYLNN